jgi:hypothetical protein
MYFDKVANILGNVIEVVIISSRKEAVSCFGKVVI